MAEKIPCDQETSALKLSPNFYPAPVKKTPYRLLFSLRRSVFVAAVLVILPTIPANAADRDGEPINKKTLGIKANGFRIVFPKNFVESPLDDTVWTDGTGDWFNPSNWSAGVPNAITGAFINVSGAGSSWTNNSFLELSGTGGNGTLHIMNSGTVSNGSCIMGTFSGTGTATVEGTGSTWTNDGDLIVGNNFSGVGMVIISDGAQVTSSNGFLGFDSPSTGTVEVDGVASTWTNSGNLYVGGSDNGAGGVGVLHLTNGGTVSAQSVTVWSQGTLGGNSVIQVTNGMTNPWHAWSRADALY